MRKNFYKDKTPHRESKLLESKRNETFAKILLLTVYHRKRSNDDFFSTRGVRKKDDRCAKIRTVDTIAILLPTTNINIFFNYRKSFDAGEL